MKIYPYKMGSKSAKALADALGCKQINHEGKPIRVDCLVNWGASNIGRKLFIAQDGSGGLNILNSPDAVKKASNKLSSFNAFEQAGVAVPAFTTELQQAVKWLAEGFDVVRRGVLSGHSGAGISIHTQLYDIEDLKGAPLYTKYVKKHQEYRIHVFRGEVIFQQRKARKHDVHDEEVNWKVRNLAGGFIFANQDVDAGEQARRESIKAVQSLGLDFGAVDVITNKAGQVFVLEVNSAPGVEGGTILAYKKAFEKFV